MYSDLSPKAKAFVPPAPKINNSNTTNTNTKHENTRIRNKKKEYRPIQRGFTGTNIGNINYISNPFHMPYVTPNLYKLGNIPYFSYFSK